MSEGRRPAPIATECDLVLKEIWRAKDTLSAVYRHDLRKMFAEAREREKRSVHVVVDLSRGAPEGKG